uniref:Ig-like domain-containing protein n=1 Tax=Takifugu rubripes TaxID=31033 RepID=A0A3B5K7R4_TAKRU
GQPSKVTCTATFTCLKQAPVFKWSYGNMPAFTSISQIAKTQWKSESTLTFTASANDNGRSLTCNQYPPVYDERQNVISKYRGITSLTGSVGEQNCSLKINKLDEIHGQDRLYPWIDKNPITFYHMADHSFYDKTTQIIILGRYLVRLFYFPNPACHQETSVVCSVQHTCFSSPPLLTISGILGSDRTSDTSVEATHTLLPQGVWKSTSTITFMADGGDGEKSLTCTASYWRGRKQATTGQLTVKGQWMQFCLWGCHIFSLFTLFTAYVNRITGFPVKKVSPSNNTCLNPTPDCYRSCSGHL